MQPDMVSTSDKQWAGVPVAWAAVAPNGQPMWLGYDRPADAPAVPLYRHQKPALTADEREAVEIAANHLDGGGWSSATLRGLLERMK